jgi:hypothetical protein
LSRTSISYFLILIEISGANSALKMATYLAFGLANQLSRCYENRIPGGQRFLQCDCSDYDSQFGVDSTKELGDKYNRFFTELANREQNQRALPVQNIDINNLMEYTRNAIEPRRAEGFVNELKNRVRGIVNILNSEEYTARWPHNPLDPDEVANGIDRLKPRGEGRIIHLIYQCRAGRWLVTKFPRTQVPWNKN